MPAFITSVAVAIVVAVVAVFALDGARPADKAYTTTGARITHDGHNLVGRDWYSSKQF